MSRERQWKKSRLRRERREKANLQLTWLGRGSKT